MINQTEYGDRYMLQKSDTSIEESSAAILKAGFDVGFLVPTDIAMGKSIIDAHDSMRAFLKRNGIHDYSTQPQGPKKYIKAQYVTSSEVYEKKVSLYRPKTKKGDPRIWVYDLKQLASPFNLLAFIYAEKQLFIVNCSNAADLNKALRDVIPKPRQVLSPVASELLLKLKAISVKGYLPTLRTGDTGVGMTLETMLGIQANSSRLPDYKGIEIKATRIEHMGAQRRKNQLFSKVPNWKLSPVGSAKKLLDIRGYKDENNRLSLYHTISGDKPNSLGLYLDVDYANEYLRQMFVDVSDDDYKPEHDTSWVINDLKKALIKKHKETFWVKARHNNNREGEKFHYVLVEHTASPYVDKLESLFETGLVTVDYLMHLKEQRVRDHGYLFKLEPKNMGALFPSAKVYDLTQ